MQTDLSKRFGNLNGGVMDIKSHAWFKTLDWEACLTKRLSAPIKYVSTVRCTLTSHPVLPALNPLPKDLLCIERDECMNNHL